MSSTVGPALMYTVLALCLFLLMILQDNSLPAEMYTAAVSRFDTSPWRLNPTKTVRQVKGGPEVYAWLTHVFVNQLYIEAERDHVAEDLNRSLMVGSFNKALAARITLKRRFLNKPTDSVMANAIARGMSYKNSDARSYKSSDELTTAFGASQKFKYEMGKGYNNAGGYVQMLNLESPKSAIMEQLAGLKDNFWFDLSQGSFAVELLYFNGNVDRFLYVAYTFEHDYTGLTEVRLQVSPLCMTIHDFSSFATWVRFCIYLVVISFYIAFFKSEMEDMTADCRNYFSQPMSFLHISSFVVILYTMVLYSTLVFNFTFLNLRLPLNSDPNKKIEQFQSLAHLASTNDSFNQALSTSTCIVVLQAILLLTSSSLLTQWRRIIGSMSCVGPHLIAFFAIFFIMMFGFAQAGHDLFGLKLTQFGSFGRSVLTVMEMIKGKANYKEILTADADMGDTYWFFLEVFFLVFQQLLGAILVRGFYMQREEQSEIDESALPLQRFLKYMRTGLSRLLSNIRRILAPIAQLFACLFPSSGQRQEDFGKVARLHDKRPTMPAKRSVVYEQQMDDMEPVVIADDLLLRVEKPYYPGGMMNYYVERTAREGPAVDGKVQKGFRLMGIRSEGAWDFKKFRSFASYQGDPQAVLKELTTLPVQLEFQGPARLLSLECIAFLFFSGVFLVFGLYVARVEDVFSLVSVQKEAIAGQHWVETSRSRVMSFEKIRLEDRSSFSQWMQGIFFQSHMGCSKELGSSTCRESTAARKDWALWVASSEQDNFTLSNFTNPAEAERAGIRLYDRQRPPGAVGLSMGFVPDGLPNATANESGVQDSSVDALLSMHDGKSVGVMRNNYARLTVQTTCFQSNEDERFREGYPYVVDPVILKHVTCSSAPCMKDMIKAKTDCLTWGGLKRDKTKMHGANSSLLYQYAEEGTYLQNGGIAIGFGMNLVEANFVWEKIIQDLSTDVVSLALEFVDFNGNQDMFTYTKVGVDVKATGEIARDVSTVVFPMNIFSMGYQDDSKSRATVNWVLFGCYIFGTCLFILFLLRDIWVQVSLTRLSKSWYMFISDFFMTDSWNLPDVVCLGLNVFVLESVFSYIFLDGGLDLKRGFHSWTLDYTVANSISSEYQDPFHKFCRVAQIYERFSMLMAVNGLYVSIRVLKYFRSLAALRLMLTSVLDSICEFLLLMTMFIGLMVAFAFMFYLRCGIQLPRYGTMLRASKELFYSLMGSFEGDDIFNVDPTFLTFAFLFFQVSFLLVINVFVAGILHHWRDSRRDAEYFSVSSAVHTFVDFVKFSRSAKQAGQLNDDGKKMQKLDEGFWQQLSVLRHVAALDGQGRIFPSTSSGGIDLGKKLGDMEDVKDVTEEDELSDAGSHKERQGVFNFKKEEDRKRFIKVFKKAHMDIASQMSRSCNFRKDRGGGVDFDGEQFLPEDENRESDPTLDKKMEHEANMATIGILEEPQPQETASAIVRQMQQLLEASERPAREMWLDALLTVLEESGALRQLQLFFLPKPMIHPKKTQDWNAFYQKKEKMERRLNRFFNLLMEESEVMHFRYLKEMAVAKERVLKQQSLVLNDYLVSLDSQIANLHSEINNLEKRNASIQTHVSPLL